VQIGEQPTGEQIPQQISLFNAKDMAGSYATQRRETLEIAPDTLQAWKQKVLAFQQKIQINAPVAQASLFDPIDFDSDTANTHDPETFNPFSLPPQNTQFWRWKAEDAGVSALYFVIDYKIDLLLYVGETVQSNKRWKGTHDCKRYLLNYQQAHYQFDMPTQLGIAFWQDAPQATRTRQKLESSLILKWRSPFNKENWAFWGTPFTGGK
jgi:hypothetical protein